MRTLNDNQSSNLVMHFTKTILIGFWEPQGTFYSCENNWSGAILYTTFWGRKKWWENEIFEGKNEHLLLGVQQGLVVQVDEGH